MSSCHSNFVGEIEHTNYLSKDIGALYLSGDYSDITLIVSGQRFDVHKAILAARSQYFRALLYGGLKESTQSEIELKEPTIPAFKELLKYIYTGHISLSNQKEEVILDILGLVHQYSFIQLESAICDYLIEIHSLENVCIIFDAARLYQLENLMKVCYSFMDKDAAKIIKHKSFLQLSSCALIDLLARDSFFAVEIEIFQAVQSWIEANTGVEFDKILEQVRLNLISISHLLKIVRPTALVSSDAILDAIAANLEPKNLHLNYRGLLLTDVDIVGSCIDTEVLQGEAGHYLLDGDCVSYDLERGYTWHQINGPPDNCILIKFGNQCIINHMKMLLWDLDSRSYSYYIEVSVDKKNWVEVIDHSDYLCRSWQYIYFEPRVVLYIRIIGTNNTVNKVFHLVRFEAYFIHHSEKLSNGIIIPTRNVALMKQGACVNEGVSRSRNVLLNGDLQNYDWERGYTCHQLNSGCIQIQLGQPYMIDSMRLLLWDCDDRSYSYYIQVSSDLKNWELIVDKTKESCRSWQILRFSPPRVVVFIKIIGTNNTANGVFHCVHFECPAQENEIN
ncbi:PREDICTED: BTB/POZ domain-containing protein 9 [Ceratosolen solmsi marchali]|uniref:BTB/POZ domain-containing protein 9 n=1 Tax=Ceratosolen solmsi marchali TaxID=326594 RepID=A0AAJ6YW40_9HYME|nr:PREDICTED: BTB/POZ domain-containing protein 9 [Ceratosolen solmsi marchali]